MPDKKTKIKNWTRLQTKIGKKAIFPLVILGLLSSLIAVGMAWVIAEIIGKILVPSIPIQFPISILIFTMVAGIGSMDCLTTTYSFFRVFSSTMVSVDYGFMWFDGSYCTGNFWNWSSHGCKKAIFGNDPFAGSIS